LFAELPVKRVVAMLPLFAFVQLVSFVSGFAQADTSVSLQRTSLTVARTYVAERDTRDDVRLPSNLVVTPAYRQIVSSMLAHSPAFRRQCLRIGIASHLAVTLLGEDATTPSESRAFTRISRDRDGGLRAVVQIREIADATELIAHEFEHIIEQLDGVDLKSLAAFETSGVRQCRCGEGDAFETARAVHAGLQVAREVAARAR
jgi:hypothetical protein